MYYWIYQDSQRDWRWSLYASNNQRIADSSAGYQHKEQCLIDIERVKTSSSAIVKEGPSNLGAKKGSRITGRDQRHK
jgi:uncharacterized protein YegP (UPF0339 family)